MTTIDTVRRTAARAAIPGDRVMADKRGSSIRLSLYRSSCDGTTLYASAEMSDGDDTSIVVSHVRAIFERMSAMVEKRRLNLIGLI